MNLIPFRTKRAIGLEPLNLSTMSDFRNEMSRMLEGFGTALTPTWFDASGQWLPTIDVSDKESQYLVRAELPGIEPNDVEVNVTEDRLTISGEKKTTAESAGNGWSHRESQCGAFSRTIPLPETVDPSKVTARYDKGVLTVELTKSPASKARKVPVQAT